MIVSFNLAPEDVARLDEMAGPRGRSRWLRRHIEQQYTEWRDGQVIALAARSASTRRKASTTRKKA